MREIVNEECYKVIRTLKYLFAVVIYDLLIYYFIITMIVALYLYFHISILYFKNKIK